MDLEYKSRTRATDLQMEKEDEEKKNKSLVKK